jgi:hypothetical protein
VPRSSDKRRAPRKQLRHQGWIAARNSAVLQQCTLSDISDVGARIDVQHVDDIPDEFILLLTRNAKTRRECRVVWRSDSQIGVHFDRGRR